MATQTKEATVHITELIANVSEAITKVVSYIKGMLEDIKYSIVAIDDSFVDKREVGQHIYDAAGVDARSVEKEILRILQ